MLFDQVQRLASALPDDPKPSWRPWGPAGGLDPFARDASSVRERFEHLRRRLPLARIHAIAPEARRQPRYRTSPAAAAAAASNAGDGRDEPAPRSNGDARLLLALLADCLVGSCYGIRDRLQDWDEMLEASIRGRQSSANTIHLQARGWVAAMPSVCTTILPHLKFTFPMSFRFFSRPKF
jgi:hypothetical protein